MYRLFITLSLAINYYNYVLSTEQSALKSNQNEYNTTNSTQGSENISNLEDVDLKCGTVPPFCAKSRYRNIDGSCNNLNNPSWGAQQTPYSRLLEANYGDGISSFPKSVTGKNLRNVREIRLNIFPDKIDKTDTDPEHSLITMQWGQIVAHDMSLTSGVPQTRKQPLTCCDANGTLTEDGRNNPLCAPIFISPFDPVYSRVGKLCIDFVRTRSTRDNNCTAANVPAEPLSAITAYLDLSLVYGDSKTMADAVRAGIGGRLLTSIRNNQEWPPQDPTPNLTCDLLKKPTSPCYLAGDIRVNQNPQLVVLHVTLLREHNRIANELHKLNPHWDDEKLYQEARRILIAIHQKITYYDYLPEIIGLKNMIDNKLIYPDEEDYVNDYDPTVNPSVYVEHASAAFRIFHSSIRGALQEYKENRRKIGELRLSNHFNNPSVLEENDGYDNLARGLSIQMQSCNDQRFEKEISEYLFRVSNEYGNDLRSIDMQRSREQGLPSYVNVRAVCGLPVPKTYFDMLPYMSPSNIFKLMLNYASIQDVELTVAGPLEYYIPGIQVGPTFKCIITKQFFRTRVGDRFYFENGEDPVIAFTESQLRSIKRGASISRILCDNVISIKSMQPQAFKKIGYGNKLVHCKKLPSVDLTLWKENLM